MAWHGDGAGWNGALGNNNALKELVIYLSKCKDKSKYLVNIVVLKH